MHEIHLVKNLVATLEKELASSEIGEIKTIRLEVGQLQHLTNDGINECFKHVPKSDKLKNAKIEIKVLPTILKCSDCGEQTVAKDKDIKCKNCAGTNLVVVSGNEFNLKGVDW